MAGKVISLNTFNGGMTSDDRSEIDNEFALLQHFDTYTRAHRLTPHNTLASVDSASTTYEMTDFLYYGSLVWGLGHTSGGVHPEVRSSTLGVADSWTGYAGGANTVLPGAFVQYHSYLYGGYSDSYSVWKFDTSGHSFTDAADSATLSDYITANGVVHSKDDILYFGCGKYIAKNNAGTWTAAALTLPTGYTIAALCEYGDYLAIGCRTNRNGKSVVYLWDRNTALATVSESIDWGTGDIYILKQVEEQLIGISLDTTGSRTDPRIIFREYVSGVGALTFREFVGSATTTFSLGGSSVTCAQVVNNRLYFPMEAKLAGTQRSGIWCVGRPSPNKPWAVWLDYMPNGDTVVSGLKGFVVVGANIVLAYNNSGYAVKSITSTAAYSGTSVVKTNINQGMPVADLTKQKQLKALAVSMVPLTSDQQVVLKYAVDGGSLVTARTTTATGTVTAEMSTATLTQQTGREFVFQVESTGGAEITEIKYLYEINNTLL